MQKLGHVLWIGGPPGTGKTTIAKRISRRRGLRYYNSDARTWEHRDRALLAGHPAAHRWEAMTPKERWVTPTAAEMFELTLHRERGPMIVEDLRRLPTSPLVVADGTTVWPDLVGAGIAEHDRALWLVPTRRLLKARLEERDLGDGPRRLALFLATELEREVSEHGVQVLPVDRGQTVEQMVAAVERVFADALAAGPRAETTAERRELLRYANAAIVSQYRAYLARPWTTGDPESIVLSFACECGEVECEAVVRIALASFPDEPLLAEGHI